MTISSERVAFDRNGRIVKRRLGLAHEIDAATFMLSRAEMACLQHHPGHAANDDLHQPMW